MEALRRMHMRSGCCSLCGKQTRHLEGHHESYAPDVLVMLCHLCHHTRHFDPRKLPLTARIVLARARAVGHPELTEAEVISYAEHMHPVGKKGLQ